MHSFHNSGKYAKEDFRRSPFFLTCAFKSSTSNCNSEISPCNSSLSLIKSVFLNLLSSCICSSSDWSSAFSFSRSVTLVTSFWFQALRSMFSFSSFLQAKIREIENKHQGSRYKRALKPHTENLWHRLTPPPYPSRHEQEKQGIPQVSNLHNWRCCWNTMETSREKTSWTGIRKEKNQLYSILHATSLVIFLDRPSVKPSATKPKHVSRYEVVQFCTYSALIWLSVSSITFSFSHSETRLLGLSGGSPCNKQ